MSCLSCPCLCHVSVTQDPGKATSVAVTLSDSGKVRGTKWLGEGCQQQQEAVVIKAWLAQGWSLLQGQVVLTELGFWSVRVMAAGRTLHFFNPSHLCQ